MTLNHSPDPLPIAEEAPTLPSKDELLVSRTQIATEDPNHVKQELWDTQERLGFVLESISDYALLLLDVHGTITGWSAGAEKILGYTEQEIIGQKVHRIFTPEDVKAEIPQREMKLSEIHGRAMDDRWHLRKDGTRFWATGYMRPLYLFEDGKKLRGYAKLVRELTATKQAEERIKQLNESLEERVRIRTHELDEANRELEAFSYSVAHDLRAPLRGVSGFAQVLLEEYAEKLDTTGQDYLRRICSASRHMGLLIDDLLSLSGLARNNVRMEKINLSDLASSIVTDLKQAQSLRNVTVVIKPDLWAFADARLLRIALTNLLNNAWKFTSKHPQARIEFGGETIDGKETYFVRDDGAGFDMAFSDQLFGVFKRLHTNEEFPGTGVGLAMVQRIVRRHGGRIWAKGEPDRGATFYFTVGGESVPAGPIAQTP